MRSFNTVGVIGKRRDPRAALTVAQVCEVLRGHGRAPLVDSETRQQLAGFAVESADMDTLGRRCELAIVVGGDGTLLSAGRALAAHGVPLLGVNQGHLGFMVDVAPDDVSQRIGEVLAGRYVLERRLLLSALVNAQRTERRRGPFIAVNDIVLRNQGSIRMLDFETWLDQGFISRHRADGLIVSTPTGSTAYALSGGGPVLHPSLSAIVLVPICPHTLSDRPIVVTRESRIRIVLRGEVAGVALTCDGQISEPLEPGDEVQIEAAPYELRLIHPANYDYFHILREKLHWGRAPAGVLER
jgi:NAD+ kinase